MDDPTDVLKPLIDKMFLHMQTFISSELLRLHIEDKRRWVEFHEALRVATQPPVQGTKGDQHNYVRAQLDYLAYQAGLDVSQLTAIIFAQIDEHYHQNAKELEIERRRISDGTHSTAIAVEDFLADLDKQQ